MLLRQSEVVDVYIPEAFFPHEQAEELVGVGEVAGVEYKHSDKVVKALHVAQLRVGSTVGDQDSPKDALELGFVE